MLYLKPRLDIISTDESGAGHDRGLRGLLMPIIFPMAIKHAYSESISLEFILSSAADALAASAARAPMQTLIPSGH
jgi:hypothetical protein